MYQSAKNDLCLLILKEFFIGKVVCSQIFSAKNQQFSAQYRTSSGNVLYSRHYFRFSTFYDAIMMQSNRKNCEQIMNITVMLQIQNRY